MKSFEKVKKFHVMDVVCDVCGKSCRECYNTEYASVQSDWGETGELHLCKECFKKTLGYLSSIAVDSTKLNLVIVD